MDVAVGETLTIRGKNFIAGRNKNTVVFKRDGARAVFAKADDRHEEDAARSRSRSRCRSSSALNAGNPVPTRFRLRVLAKKFGKKFTGNKLSPIVSAPRPPQRGHARRRRCRTATATATGRRTSTTATTTTTG